MTEITVDLLLSPNAGVRVGHNADMATLYIGERFHPVLTVYVDNPRLADPAANRLADLVVLADLGRRIVNVCELAMAEDRANIDAATDERATK